MDRVTLGWVIVPVPGPGPSAEYTYTSGYSPWQSRELLLISCFSKTEKLGNQGIESLHNLAIPLGQTKNIEVLVATDGVVLSWSNLMQPPAGEMAKRIMKKNNLWGKSPYNEKILKLVIQACPISEAVLFAINGYNEESITNLWKLWGVKRDELSLGLCDRTKAKRHQLQKGKLCLDIRKKCMD
ncbi:hypothetical protein TURU_104958 [Turdus rufiventris]|nr:hypothetical protein TURU_104958 [Turdus rufiventris]